MEIVRDEVDNSSCGDRAGGREGEALAVHEGDQGLASPCTESKGVEEVVVVECAVDEGDEEESDCISHSLIDGHVGVVEKSNHVSNWEV